MGDKPNEKMTDKMRNRLEVEAFQRVLAEVELESASSRDEVSSDEERVEKRGGKLRLDRTERTYAEDSDTESLAFEARGRAEDVNSSINRIDSLDRNNNVYISQNAELSQALEASYALSQAHTFESYRERPGNDASLGESSRHIDFSLGVSDALSDADIMKLIEEQEKEEMRENEAAINAAIEESRAAATPPKYSKEQVHELYRLCMEARPNQLGQMDPKMWDPIRSYLAKDPGLVRLAARIPNSDKLLPLHQVCRHNPPMDVIELFMSCCDLDLLTMADSNGMLPLHHACIHSASDEVIRALVQLYPESKEHQDSKGSTPLHYAVANVNSSVDIIHCLTSEAAAGTCDEHGMLPIHYTVVYKAFAKPSIIRQLIVANPRGLSNADLKGRIPIRWLAKSCHFPEVFDLLQFSIAFDPSLARGDMGVILLNHIAENAERYGRCNCTQAFLNLLLENNPEPTEAYTETLQRLPRWMNKKGELKKSRSFFKRLKCKKESR